MEQTCLNEFLAFVKGTKKEVNKEIISVANHGSAALGGGGRGVILAALKGPSIM